MKLQKSGEKNTSTIHVVADLEFSVAEETTYFWEIVVPDGKKSKLNSWSAKKIRTVLQKGCLPYGFLVCGWLVCFSEAAR